MALIPEHNISVEGLPPSFLPAASGDTAKVGEGRKLEVRNAGSEMTVTIAVPGNLETGVAYPDKVYTVPATTGEKRIPLLKIYADPTDGLAHISYSSTTSVTRAAVRG